MLIMSECVCERERALRKPEVCRVSKTLGEGKKNHSVKVLPSVTLAKRHSENLYLTKSSLSSVFCRPLNEGFD